MQTDTLFMYFCGTEEETGKHVTRLMPAIEAKYQLYINGVAAGRTDFRRLDKVFREDQNAFKKISGWCLPFPGEKSAFLHRIHDLQVAPIPGARNSQHCRFSFEVQEENQKAYRQIYTIEKQYDGYRIASAFGYSENDIQKVVAYTLDRLMAILHQHPEIRHVVLSGHSRGAAVGLSSFLYYLLESLDMPLVGHAGTVGERLRALSRLDVLFLDPVAGQMSSANYHRLRHKRDWTTADLYHDLSAELPNLNSITEVYANAAKMATKLAVGLRSFDPSRSFLEDFCLAQNNLFKFFLGFSHSAMVDPCDLKGLPQVYDRVQHHASIAEYQGDYLLHLFQRLAGGRKPFDLIVDYINTYADFCQGPEANHARYQKYHASFADSDGIFAQLIAAYNEPAVTLRKHLHQGRERTAYEILDEVFPKKEVVDQVLGFVKLRRDAVYVNHRGEKTILAKLVENNALSFGVVPAGVFELGEVVERYVAAHGEEEAL